MPNQLEVVSILEPQVKAKLPKHRLDEVTAS